MIRLWFDIATDVKLGKPQQAIENIKVYTLLNKLVNCMYNFIVYNHTEYFITS